VFAIPRLSVFDELLRKFAAVAETTDAEFRGTELQRARETGIKTEKSGVPGVIVKADPASPGSAPPPAPPLTVRAISCFSDVTIGDLLERDEGFKKIWNSYKAAVEQLQLEFVREQLVYMGAELLVKKKEKLWRGRGGVSTFSWLLLKKCPSP
jgi:hypothetical protein